jgi:hypothetical protein
MSFGVDDPGGGDMLAATCIDSGFRVVENTLSLEECQGLLKTLDRSIVTRGRAGARHLMAVPEIARLAYDSGLLALARVELGGKAVPFRATLFEKSGQANWLVVWHQDTALPIRHRFEAPGWGPWSEKAGFLYAHGPAWALSRVTALRLHLDASTGDNGPLRLVPNSHTLGVLTDEEIRSAVDQRGFEECVVARGGVLVLRPLLIHSSSKVLTDAPRRVLHLEYSDSLMLAPGIELAVA